MPAPFLQFSVFVEPPVAEQKVNVNPFGLFSTVNKGFAGIGPDVGVLEVCAREIKYGPRWFKWKQVCNKVEENNRTSEPEA